MDVGPVQIQQVLITEACLSVAPDQVNSTPDC